jgi:peptide-methionine (S)-S-oxide reductase
MSESQTITLGGGCFWCTEAVYKEVRGVTDVESGYSNGQAAAAQLRAGLHRPHRPQRGGQAHLRPGAGHARASCWRSSSWCTTRPPEPPGQRRGTQYRSGIYYTTPEQKEVAETSFARPAQEKIFGKPIVTEVLPKENYWPAEAYHQDYFEKNPNQGYCAFVVGPKVEKFRKTFAQFRAGSPR